MKVFAVASLLGAASATRLNLNTLEVAGYTEMNGKCTGNWIEVWGNGAFAHYGEDHHISGVDDCADMCDQHPECAGFYVKQGKCSHWRSGAVSARSQPGHTCYVKEGGAAPAPAPHGGGGHSSGGGSCDPMAGYDVAPGKCSGRWIEVWGNGVFAHYGEDHHISGLADCADTCDSHGECAGFYSKEGKCSHWRSGSLSVSPKAGHCCYTKAGGSFLQEESAEEHRRRRRSWAPAPGSRVPCSFQIIRNIAQRASVDAAYARGEHPMCTYPRDFQ